MLIIGNKKVHTANSAMELPFPDREKMRLLIFNEFTKRVNVLHQFETVEAMTKTLSSIRKAYRLNIESFDI